MEFNPEVPMEDGYYYAHANFAKSSIVILMRDTIDCMDGTYEVVWYAMGNESPLKTDILDRIRFGEKVPLPTKFPVTEEIYTEKVDVETRFYQIATFVMSGTAVTILVWILSIVLEGGATSHFLSGYSAGIATVFLGLLVITKWVLKRTKGRKE